MNSLLPDPSLLVSQAKNAEWLEKELATRRLQKEFNGLPSKDEKLREAAKGFESIFIQKLWEQMRKTVPKEGYLHSKEEDQYLSMFDKDMSEKLADAGGIGLGDMLYKQLKTSMEQASRVTSPSNDENKLPIKPLGPEYDPQALLPPEARNAKLDTSLEGMEPNSALDPRDLQSLYAPMNEYDEGEEGSAGEQEYPSEPLEVESMAAPRSRRPAGPAIDPVNGAEVYQGPEEVAQAEARYSEDGAYIRTEPEVLAAVEKLAQRLVPEASPVTREQHTRLPGRDVAAAAPGEGVFQGASQEVKLLEGGIKRKQGALENQGGPEDSGVMPAASVSEATQVDAEASPSSPFHWPVDGRLTSSFGWRRSPLTGQRVYHEGVDLAAGFNDPVHSCWDGTVSFVGQKPGYGNVVVVEHSGGWESVYAHNNESAVKTGDAVKAGQKIASVGSTGRSTGPHLHFEIRHQGTAFDPMKIQNSLIAGRAIGHGA